jgi:hypothetical protein
MTRLGVAAVAILLLTAGCVADPGVGVPGSGDPVQAPSLEPIEFDPHGVGDGSAGGPRMVDSLPENPWGSETVTVAIAAPEPDDDVSDFRPAVAEAVDYWNDNDRRYGEYAVEFELDADALDPDVVVRFTSTVRCKGEVGYLGCAPVLDRMSTVDRPTTVLVNSEYDAATVGRAVKHEFGHLLGVRHGEEPMPLMEADTAGRATVDVDTLNRANPWREDVIEVYVATGGMSDRRAAAVREQVDHALAYYDAGAEGTVPENVSFRLADSRSDAEVVVLFQKDPLCREGPGSCAEVNGVDVDRDGGVEYYSGSTIVLTEVSTDAVGWHVGYWLGEAMGASSRDELPPAFRSGADRTGDWWNESA